MKGKHAFFYCILTLTLPQIFRHCTHAMGFSSCSREKNPRSTYFFYNIKSTWQWMISITIAVAKDWVAPVIRKSLFFQDSFVWFLMGQLFGGVVSFDTDIHGHTALCYIRGTKDKRRLDLALYWWSCSFECGWFDTVCNSSVIVLH